VHLMCGREPQFDSAWLGQGVWHPRDSRAPAFNAQAWRHAWGLGRGARGWFGRGGGASGSVAWYR
jgi:hypothetical protein